MQTKLQEISRKVFSKSFFIAMPAQVVRDINAKKGDVFEWIVSKDKKTITLKKTAWVPQSAFIKHWEQLKIFAEDKDAFTIYKLL